MIIGGTGALGTSLTNRWYNDNEIIVFSRNEHKQEAMKRDFPKSLYRIGDVRLKSRNVNIINKKNHFFSRVHVEDIANVLFKSLSNFKSSEIYNISDDKPSSSEEVTLYGVKLLNVDIP